MLKRFTAFLLALLFALPAGAAVTYRADGVWGAGKGTALTYLELDTNFWEIEVLRSDIASTAAAKGASLVGVQDVGSRFTGTTVEAALAEAATTADLASTASGKGVELVANARRVVNVVDYGATGDGSTDDTASIVVAASAVSDGDTLYFPPGTYRVAWDNATSDDDYGRKVIKLQDLDGVSVIGDDATIYVSSHNVATGGLVFLWGDNVRHLNVSGFRFEMNFTGANNSSSYYPFCGGIVITNTVYDGVQDSESISHSLHFSDLSFKIFHPWGQYIQTTAGNDYGGDSNNGGKMLSVYAAGDHLATSRANQNYDLQVDRVHFESGHNGYGIWAWAYNDVVVRDCSAGSWVGKYSSNAGTYAGAGVPFIRYTQFYCSGFWVQSCRFVAKPCNLRIAGFEGSAQFAYVGQNLTGNYSHGYSLFDSNSIILGNGDAAKTALDYGVSIYGYGYVGVTNNYFDGITETVNAYGGTGIYYGSESVGSNGSGDLEITGNTFGRKNSYNNSIVVANGSNVSAADRRLKSLLISGNTSLSQSQYFVDMYSGSVKTFLGVASAIITNNIVVGTDNTVFTPASTNSRAFALAAASGDKLIVSENEVTDKYYLAMVTAVSSSASVLFNNNLRSGVTSVFSGTTTKDLYSQAGTFTPLVEGTAAAGVGTYTTQSGRYTRLGNLVFWSATVVVTAHTGAGNIQLNLNDIPWSSTNISAAKVWPATVLNSNLTIGAGKVLGAAVGNNSKIVSMYAVETAAAMAAFALDTAFTLSLSGVYETN